MKKVLIPLLVLLCSFITFAQDENMDAQAGQDAWMKFMTPGEPHAMLAKGAGEWIVNSKYWMAPGTESMAAEGSAVGEMLMGGRYLKVMHTGNMMGMPFEGMSLEGYDNGTGKHFSVWIDNLGTGIAFAEGFYDEETGMIVYEGTMTDPVTNGSAWFKQTMKIVDDNTHYFEMFGKAPDGSEFKSMEITFTKK